ncbi:MAG TPA: PepSY-associated TM helix domain-containing protein, partial [Xanthobacteraceae bacterium]|nr:PepSY-associated TM helix domain-containing protein [Xanthobacteraceae bacterium]
MASRSVSARRIFLAAHRWIAIALFLLLVPVSLSGALLVFHDELDAILNPPRYAISGSETLAPSAYLKSAAAAV